MATDIKKFLDQAGVSTLWSRIAEEVSKVDEKAVANATAIASQGKRLEAAETAIAALEAGTYDDSELRTLIESNKTAHQANATAIEILNGDGDGSVSKIATTIAATKVAEIVAGADADFDTLKEIADWILNDTTGAADMANKIAALTTLVGSESVATLENAGYQDAEAVATAIDAKIAALNLANAYDVKGAAAAAETAAKAHADSLNSAMNARVVALEGIDHTKFETAGAAAQALADSKAYTDAEIAGHVTAMSTSEIDAAIAAAKAQA